jgi:hypothetical protein
MLTERQSSTMLRIVLTALVLSIFAALPGVAADPHALFEERCGRCHGHAGDFARETLYLDEGIVKGRKTRTDVRKFLPRHFGKLTAEEIDLLQSTFALQIESAGLFQAKCRICHGPAKDLARLHLILRDGELVGRYSGAPMRDFLARHGRATPEEADVLYRVLEWQLTTAAPSQSAN